MYGCSHKLLGWSPIQYFPNLQRWFLTSWLCWILCIHLGARILNYQSTKLNNPQSINISTLQVETRKRVSKNQKVGSMCSSKLCSFKDFNVQHIVVFDVKVIFATRVNYAVSLILKWMWILYVVCFIVLGFRVNILHCFLSTLTKFWTKFQATCNAAWNITSKQCKMCSKSRWILMWMLKHALLTK